MVACLAREGVPISRDRIRNVLRRMGLRAIYQKPRTTVPGHPSERFPCLVDLREITAVDQAWATDIIYIPLQKERRPLPGGDHGSPFQERAQLEALQQP
jgi:putative transposase